LIAAIAGKYEFETRSGTAMRATLTQPPAAVETHNQLHFATNPGA
jgi:hypothetical protein